MTNVQEINNDGTIETINLKDFLCRWVASRAKTEQVIASGAESILEFRPGKEYRTVREQIVHLVAAQISIVSGIADGNFPWKQNADDLQTLPVSKVVERGQEANKALAQLLVAHPGSWFAERAPGTELTREEWLWEMFEHEIHHRGTLTLSLRLAGKTPPKFHA